MVKHYGDLDKVGTISGSIGAFSTTLTVSGLPVSIVGGGINNVVEDTTPQLGGDLDVNGKKITAAVGNVLIEALPSSDITLTAGNAGDIYLTTGTVSTINLTAGTAGEINLTTGGGGSIDLASPVVTGTEFRTGGIISAHTGNYKHSLTISGVSVMHQGITGITISGSTLTKGQVDFRGSRGGNVSFSNGTLFFDAPPAGTGGGGGITAVVQDTAPQLGGNLGVNGKSITATAGNTVLIKPADTGRVEIFTGKAINLSPSNNGIYIAASGTTGEIILSTAFGTTAENISLRSGQHINLETQAASSTIGIYALGSNNIVDVRATGTGGYIQMISDIEMFLISNSQISLEPVVTGTEFRAAGTMRAQTGRFSSNLFATLKNATNDTNAATAGVSVGEFYHNAGAVRVRLT